MCSFSIHRRIHIPVPDVCVPLLPRGTSSSTNPQPHASRGGYLSSYPSRKLNMISRYGVPGACAPLTPIHHNTHSPHSVASQNPFFVHMYVDGRARLLSLFSVRWFSFFDLWAQIRNRPRGRVVKRVVWYGRGYVIVKLERGRDLEPFHGSASLVGHTLPLFHPRWSCGWSWRA